MLWNHETFNAANHGPFLVGNTKSAPWNHQGNKDCQILMAISRPLLFLPGAPLSECLFHHKQQQQQQRMLWSLLHSWGCPGGGVGAGYPRCKCGERFQRDPKCYYWRLNVAWRKAAVAIFASTWFEWAHYCNVPVLQSACEGWAICNHETHEQHKDQMVEGSAPSLPEKTGLFALNTTGIDLSRCCPRPPVGSRRGEERDKGRCSLHHTWTPGAQQLELKSLEPC